MQAHPDTVQHLVNALVRAMRYVNTHDANQIAAQLPADYFKGKERRAAVEYIRDTLPSYAKGDYSFSPAAAKVVVDAVQLSDFDQSSEGQWRATGDNSKFHVEDLYTNRFVDVAMKNIK
jgi:NitT/TauT family transport system substrate-binding protein